MEEECGLAVGHALESQLDDDGPVDVIEVDPSLDELALNQQIVTLAFGYGATLELLCEYPRAVGL